MNDTPRVEGRARGDRRAMDRQWISVGSILLHLNLGKGAQT